MSSFVRTFVALPLSDRAALGLCAIQRSLDVADSQIRWTEPSQFHITLRFLGDVVESAIPRVIEAVRSAVRSRNALTLTFQGVGAFPGWKKPRILWSRVALGSDDLINLATEVRGSLAWVVQGEDKTFIPHVTLGRVRRATSPELLMQAARGCAKVQVGPELVDRVVVYESRLSSKGARYVELGSASMISAVSKKELCD